MRTLPEQSAQVVVDSPELLPEPLTGGIPATARDILILSSFLLVPVVAAAGLIAGAEMGFGVLGGGIVALANFWLLSRIVVETTSGEVNGAVLFGRMVAKFVLLAASLGIVILLFRLDSIGVLVGVGTIFPSILLGSLLDVFRGKSASPGVTN